MGREALDYPSSSSARTLSRVLRSARTSPPTRQDSSADSSAFLISAALCANVTETAPLVETTVEGEQECDHVVEHVQEERHRLFRGGNGVRGPG